MPLNDSNFLMWFGPGESPVVPTLPRPFVHEPEVLSPVVWLVPGEGMQFYVNSPANVALTGAIALEHERSGNLAHFVVHRLFTFDFPTGQHTYGDLVVPDGLPEGFVRLVCGTFKTQWLWLTTIEQAQKFTVRVAMSNSGRRVQNFRYAFTPEGWQQKFRIRLSVDSEEPAHNKEIYTESDTGKRRHLYSEPTWIVKLITPEYDRWGHRAMASLIEHDTILLNEKPYTYQSPYRANMSLGDALSTGEVELCEEVYSTLHRA